MKVLKLKRYDEGFDGSKLITNPEPFDSKRMFTEDGIYSQTIFGEQGTLEVYRCSCGKTQGSFYEGATCQHCGTECKSLNPLAIIGWIPLHGHKVFHPVYWKMLSRAITPKVLDRIAVYHRPSDIDGNKSAETESVSLDGIGMVGLAERLDEVVETFASDDSRGLKPWLLENKDKALAGAVPVFSPSLRPALMSKTELRTDELNKPLQFITRYASMISDQKPGTQNAKIESCLFRCQQQLMFLYDKIVERVKGKHGLIRGFLIGSRVNFSLRAVISPLPSDRPMDEIWLPWTGGIILFRFKLINMLLSKGLERNEAAAYSRITRASVGADPELAGLVNELVSSGVPLKGILNRNPTINFGSTLMVRVGKIKDDPHDHTMQISNVILPPLNADYDGDILNFVPIFDRKMMEAFGTFSPRRIILSANDGLTNRELIPEKEFTVGLSILAGG